MCFYIDELTGGPSQYEEKVGKVALQGRGMSPGSGKLCQESYCIPGQDLRLPNARHGHVLCLLCYSHQFVFL